jgi:outer membrane protein assembly factor BamA
VRTRAALGCALLALVQARAQGVSTSALLLRTLRVEGGSEDDQRFARAALGLEPGHAVDPAAFRKALEAVRLVDRFQSVDGRLDADGTARVQLVPLVPLATWAWAGDPLPAPFRKTILPELEKGQRLGPMRLEAFRALAEQRLREGGYPRAEVLARGGEGGRTLRFTVALGPAALIPSVRVEGHPAPYTPEALLKVAGILPGRSLWTAGFPREAERRLRAKFVKDGRLEGLATVRPADGTGGAAVIDVEPGPKVKLKAQGLSLFGPLFGRPRLSDFVPLARSDRYSPGLLEEGAGRIATYFRDQGFPEARVTHDRRITRGTAELPEVVTITYHVDPGPRRVIRSVRIEGNRELSEEQLRAALQLPRRHFVLAPQAKGETMRVLEDRLTAIYLQHGFPEVRVRRRAEANPDGSVDVRLVVREGRQRFLRELVLDLPQDPAYPPERLEGSLLLALSDHPVPLKGGPGRRFGSDRPTLQDSHGTLESAPGRVRLVFDRPLPLVRNDLALVVSDLRQRLSSLGSANPQVRIAFEDDDTLSLVRIQVPPQPLDHLRRVVVQGGDRTRAEAVLREVATPAEVPLDPLKLDDSQVRVAGLGAFQRVDFLGLSDLPGQKDAGWMRGDMALQLQERNPWVFTESFGYDKTQGYHFGLNSQRLNVGGMGRTLDFGVRAGDQTLRIPALRRAFPTGDVKRSLDSYSVGYTDPWFLPGALDAWMPSRTRMHLEGAYIEEARASFFARRRQFTSSLEWKLSPVQSVSLGYRFERVEVGANTDANNKPLLLDQDLFLLARTLARSIISAPYLQVVVDRRDKPYDPTQGTFFAARLELANQFFGTSANSSFVKLDLRHQWNWPVGFKAEHGVASAGIRVGLARPTAQSAEDLPLSERFFGGGPYSVRGVEPDMLGEILRPKSQSGTLLPQIIPLGGQGLAVVNLEYRFPFIGQSVWGEVFVDSGQVYRSLRAERIPVDASVTMQASPASSPWLPALPGSMPVKGQETLPPFPPFRTTLGIGFILKLGFPLKLEYAADWKRILGRPRSQDEKDTQLKSLLISAGFQF